MTWKTILSLLAKIIPVLIGSGVFGVMSVAGYAPGATVYPGIDAGQVSLGTGGLLGLLSALIPWEQWLKGDPKRLTADEERDQYERIKALTGSSSKSIG